MQSNQNARLTAAATIGVLGALYFRTSDERYAQMGRDAFIAAQSARFERIILHPPSIAATVIAGLGMAAVLFGLYEVVALGLSKIMRQRDTGALTKNT